MRGHDETAASSEFANAFDEAANGLADSIIGHIGGLARLKDPPDQAAIRVDGAIPQQLLAQLHALAQRLLPARGVGSALPLSRMEQA